MRCRCVQHRGADPRILCMRFTQTARSSARSTVRESVALICRFAQVERAKCVGPPLAQLVEALEERAAAKLTKQYMFFLCEHMGYRCDLWCASEPSVRQLSVGPGLLAGSAGKVFLGLWLL